MRNGSVRTCTTRSRSTLAAALLCGLAGAALPAALPAVASAAPVLPDVADGLVLHTSMMPSDSPDAVVTRGTGPQRAAATSGGTQYGIDVASYQHPHGAAVDWKAVAASGQVFVVVKATEAGYTNPYLKGDLAGAHAAGLVVGAYAFARPRYDAAAQADALARASGTLPGSSLPPVLDLEDDGGLTPSQLITWTHTFLDRLQSLTGALPMIYSAPYFWSSAMAGSTAFAKYPLWEANYTTAAQPARMGGWATYRLWQYSSSGSVPGISGAVDRDRFEGVRTDLTGPPPPVNLIDQEHATLGGDTGLLGPATSAEEDVPGGRARSYRDGVIYWSPATGAHELHGALLTAYRGAGGPASPLGLPTSDERAVPGGRGNTFPTGELLWSAATGAHAVYGEIHRRYAALGGAGGVLGLPITDEDAAPGGRVSAFQYGRTYWSPTTGAQEVRGAILDRYDALGGAGGALGLPVTGEVDVTGGRGSTFAGGEVLWSDATGAHAVYGAVREEYDAVGGPRTMGLPTSDELDEVGGRRSDFTGGRVYWSGTTGAHLVWGTILGRYLQDGAAARYGFPTTDEVPTDSGVTEEFQRASVDWDRATGATTVRLR